MAGEELIHVLQVIGLKLPAHHQKLGAESVPGCMAWSLAVYAPELLAI